MVNPGERVGLASAVLVASLSVAVAHSGIAFARQPARAIGPLAIAKAKFDQDGKQAVLAIHTRETMPSLKDLTRSPSRVEAVDERYLCLQIEGRKVGSNLFCPGGPVERNRIEVGHSTYGDDGSAKHRDDFRARIVARTPDALTLRFSLAAAGLAPGKVGWRVISGWTGEGCEPETQETENPCLDSVPQRDFEQAKIFKLVVSGCRSPGGQFRDAPNARKQVALTFDDGPSSYTASVVRILDEHRAEGTFFVIGSQVSAGAGVLRKALKHGHEIANHSYNHESLPGASSMRATNARIEDATGFTPCEFRPPYGAVNGNVVSAANSLGMSTILWDVDTRDWTLPGSGAVYSEAVSGGSGSIVLMHDGGGSRSQTVAALPEIIENYQDRGFKLVTVTDLLGGRFKLQEAG